MLCCVVRSQAAEDPLSAAVCSNTVEAQVIVHLELDDPDKGKRAGEGEEQEEEYSPLGPPPPPHTGEEDALLAHSLAQCVSPPSLDAAVANHSGETETGSSHADTQLHRGEGLTNGFHPPRTPPTQPPPAVKLEPLENGAHRHRPPTLAKGLSAGLAPSPAPFVHSTSTEHSYLCP